MQKRPEENIHDPHNSEARTDKWGESNNEKAREERPEFTQGEVQTVIHKLKKDKASDNIAIRAEDIKTCYDTTKEMIRRIFNEVIKQDDCTPETSRRIRIKVIHEKGDEEDVGNCRPICTFASAVQIVFDYSAQHTLSQTWSISIRRSGRVPAFLPSDWSLSNVHTDWAEMPEMCQNVDRDDLFHEGTWLHQPQFNMERNRTMWNWVLLHQSLEAIIRKTKSDSLDSQRERNVRE